MEVAIQAKSVWGAGGFERRYAERSGLTVQQLRELGRVVRPCRCGDESCDGFMSVSRLSALDEDVAPWNSYWAVPWRIRDWWTQARAADAVDLNVADSGKPPTRV